MFQVFETGNAVDFLALQQAPKDDHQPAVSNRQIGSNHGMPICLVFAQPSEARAGRRDEKSPLTKHRGNSFIHIAIEEAKPENLAAGNIVDVRHAERWSPACRRLNQFDCRKISAVPLDIPRSQLPTHQLCMCTDEEIWQWHTGGLTASRSRAVETVAPVNASTDCCGASGKIENDNASLAHVSFDVFAAPRAGI